MKKLLNLKNMKETIVNYSSDQKEFDKIWDTFCCYWRLLGMFEKVNYVQKK